MQKEKQVLIVESRPYPSTVWQAISIALIFIGVSIAFSPIMGICKLFSAKSIQDMGFFLYYLCTAGATAYIAYRLKRKQEKETYSPPNFAWNDTLLIVLLVGLTISIQLGVITPLNSLIPMPDSFKSLFEQLSKDMLLPGTMLATAILAPILEEYVFRGVILDGLLKRFSPQKAIIVSSILFGVVHLNPWQFIAAFTLGVLMGWIFYKTKNLLLCMIIHFANNSFAVLMNFINNGETNDDTKQMLTLGAVAIVAAVLLFMLLRNRLKQVLHNEPAS